MSIAPLTERQKSLIVNNVVKASDDINKLNKTGYNFLYLANGFIAHYNLQGFKSHYDDEGFFTQANLKQSILDNQRSNQWDNFHPSDVNYDYYMSKKDVYNRIVAKLTNKTLNLWNS